MLQIRSVAHGRSPDVWAEIARGESNPLNAPTALAMGELGCWDDHDFPVLSLADLIA
jgi:hypothetical protein